MMPKIEVQASPLRGCRFCAAESQTAYLICDSCWQKLRNAQQRITELERELASAGEVSSGLPYQQSRGLLKTQRDEARAYARRLWRWMSSSPVAVDYLASRDELLADAPEWVKEASDGK